MSICICVGKVHTLEERLRGDKKEWHVGKRTPEAFHGGYVNSTSLDIKAAVTILASPKNSICVISLRQ